ncbi:hypothetical protein [Embleya sp. AB8]|uniref:hypothetical protein n=1 Tax=Embleya sp. AB8 TaxID=3156304 RepID=UPI003C76E551
MDDNSRRAAQAARLPMVDGTTESGLPRRPPQANLLPGAAAEDFDLDRELSLSREPEEVRGRLERFAVGRELARLEESEPLLPPKPMTSEPLLPPNPMTAASPLASAPVRPPAPTPAPLQSRVVKPAPPALPAPPPGALSPLPAGWDEPWGDGWRSFRPGRP